jgi:hypothetical protein
VRETHEQESAGIQMRITLRCVGSVNRKPRPPSAVILAK